jgi:sensor histidine kinase regulating citrate/malate metabolism
MMEVQPLADVVGEIGTVTGKTIEVTLTNELIHLLSDQLYHSAIKAVEELVVNSFDAGATECRVYVPLPSRQDDRFIAVYDDGAGMDFDGLKHLWRVGRSNKRDGAVER